MHCCDGTSLVVLLVYVVFGIAAMGSLCYVSKVCGLYCCDGVSLVALLVYVVVSTAAMGSLCYVSKVRGLYCCNGVSLLVLIWYTCVFLRCVGRALLQWGLSDMILMCVACTDAMESL